MTGYTVCGSHGAGSPHKGRPGGRPPKSGINSIKLPERLRQKYEEAVVDPELLNLRSSIALVDTRLEDLLSRVDTGESGALWALAQKTWRAFLEEYRADGEHLAERLDDHDAAIEKGVEDYTAWREVLVLLEQRRKCVESEQKRLVALQQVITAEQAMLLFGSVIDIIKRTVTDRQQLAIISHELSLLVNKSRKEPALPG